MGRTAGTKAFEPKGSPVEMGSINWEKRKRMKKVASSDGREAYFLRMLPRPSIIIYRGEENGRWTGVIEKRDGRWVVVQQHFSFASDR